jgi:hypothetical protein
MENYGNCPAPTTPPAAPCKVKIECLVTCVGYADFLAVTLPINMNHFDKIVVVTAPHDKDTQRVCDYYGVQVWLTDAFQSQWAGRFCKGAGINQGLNRLDKDAWILHLDADIALPPNFRKVIEAADLDPTMIYGVDRAEFKSFEDWQRFIGAPEPNTQGGGFFCHITHHGQLLGTRVAFQHHGGYVPIGFFQLWHADSGITKYPEGHTDAGREDSHFPTLWPRRKRALIPEFVVYHLESESAQMAVNWKGRKTKPFGIGG